MPKCGPEWSCGFWMMLMAGKAGRISPKSPERRYGLPRPALHVNFCYRRVPETPLKALSAITGSWNRHRLKVSIRDLHGWKRYFATNSKSGYSAEFVPSLRGLLCLPELAKIRFAEWLVSFASHRTSSIVTPPSGLGPSKQPRFVIRSGRIR